MQNFSKNLQDLREARGLTRGQAARALRVSLDCYTRYEKGLAKNGIDFLARAAAFYNTSTDSLLAPPTQHPTAEFPTPHPTHD